VSDELTPLFGGLGEARPLPAHLGERLERVLAAEAEAGAGALATIDAPRPLPDHVRDRIEAAMVVAVEVGLPVQVRRRVERTLVRRRARDYLRPAVKAAAIMALAGATALFLGEPPPQAVDTMYAGADNLTDEASAVVVDGAAETPPRGLAHRLVTGIRAMPEMGVGGAGSTPYFSLSHPPPPFYVWPFEPLPSPLGDNGGGFPAPLPAAARTPVRIGLIGGDPVQEAGFRAYVELANRAGGAGGRRLDLVPFRTEGSIATVNLGPTAVADASGAPMGMRAPLLESLDVAEPALRGDVFSLTGVAERQARLAVESSGVQADETAVVYTASSGSFAGRVPDAFEAALRERGVQVERVRWDPAGSPALVPADAAFVSVPTADARSWLQAAKSAGYDPRRGIWGIWSLADDALVDAMPNDLQLLAPYAFARGDELAAMVDATDQAPSARLVHGWVTAKWLAVAIWWAGDEPERLGGYLRNGRFESGFAPPQETRTETNARTPEAVVLVPEDGRLEPKGPFRTDKAQ
jgi:hypothetical protein